jgi:hypothetical protein
LEPNQLIAISKRRLHAFRKMTMDDLPDHDAHCRLRKDLVDRLRMKAEANLGGVLDQTEVEDTVM